MVYIKTRSILPLLLLYGLSNEVDTWNGFLRDLRPRVKTANTDSLYGARIVGGEAISILNVPYQVSVQSNLQHFCGGAIITRIHIVTAAHCTMNKTVEQLSIRAGSTFRDAGGVVISVYMILEHPFFDLSTVDYDIAILKLITFLDFSNFIKPIPVAAPDVKLRTWTWALVTGWGIEHEGLTMEWAPRTLHAVYLQILDRTTCDLFYGFGYMTDRMLCVGSMEEKDSCQGDSGSPLVVRGVLVGVVSWGVGCARPNTPGVYTSISAVRKFINLALTY